MPNRPHYPDLSKSERKDALVPDPQEYDMSDPDSSEAPDVSSLSAKGRLDLFERLVKAGALPPISN